MSYETAGDRAYKILKDKIISLRLEPGSVINEAALIEELQMGRSPIRDALRRLEQDAFIVILPRQGTLVADSGLSDFHEIFELRHELEGFAAYLAARRAKPFHLKALQELLLEVDDNIDPRDHERDIDIDTRFHKIIRDAAANRYLSSSLEKLVAHSIRLFYLAHTRSASAVDQITDYQAIHNSIQAGDADGARDLMQAHILTSQNRIQVSLARPE
jgi:DNA-binding GntR family transcriptional regulator